MKRITRLSLCTALLLGAFLYGQDLVKRPYLVKVDTSSFDSFSGVTNVCLLVWEDGRYRLERTRQDPGGGRPDTQVFLDTLPEPSLKQLQTVLDDAQFQTIKKSHEESSAIVRDLETMQVVIPREHEIQSFFFVNAEDRRPYEKTLKPFTNWLKDVQKRKVKAAKDAKPNRCAAPMVQYRLNGPPPGVQEDPN
jgi:hypothetical protein